MAMKGQEEGKKALSLWTGPDVIKRLTEAFFLYRFEKQIMTTKRKVSRPTRKWSARVTNTSNAMDLEGGIFKSADPAEIAVSLKRSASRSKRRKGTPYQSAMSMLNFYINRAGKNLPEKQKTVLEHAKEELRRVFHRE